MSDKKKEQLGMNHSTASHRLRVDLLFSAFGHQKCLRCGKPLTRDDFSIDHVKPWLDSEDPLKEFFDLGNVAFSHKGCNYSASRNPRKKWGSQAEAQKHYDKVYREKYPERYKRQRREKYLRNGH